MSPALVPVGPGVWRAVYRFGDGGSATTLVVDTRDGLVVVSPPGGRDTPAIHEAIDALGPVRAVVAPCDFHTIGLAPARARWPDAAIHADPRLRRISARVPTLPLEALRLPDHVVVAAVPHLRRPDSFVRVGVPGGSVWFLNDVMQHLASLPANPVLRALLGLMGFRVGLAWNRFGLRWILRGDAPRVAAWLAGELDRHPPVAVVFGHGEPVTDADGLAAFRREVDAGA